MAPVAKKRSAPSKAPQSKSNKKQKLEASVKPPTSKFAKPLPAPERRKVRPDELQWKEVTLPDRLEDFEGFFGLEEIDDVVVEKDGVTGNVSFKTAGGLEKDTTQTNGEEGV
jgi:ATP-dependent RNA helicase DDX24/MAK5